MEIEVSTPVDHIDTPGGILDMNKIVKVFDYDVLVLYIRRGLSPACYPSDIELRTDIGT